MNAWFIALLATNAFLPGRILTTYLLFWENVMSIKRLSFYRLMLRAQEKGPD
jgi:hypothetical protein